VEVVFYRGGPSVLCSIQVGVCFGAARSIPSVYVDPENRREIKANLTDGTTTVILRV